MKPRISILNLLLVTTVVALAIVVLRLGRELEKEKSLRAEMLQKGGILQVADTESVHVVQVSSRGEPGTWRWRVYVPERRAVTLNARVEPVPADKPIAPRLPPNAIVVAERSPANSVNLGPGEHVVSLTSSREESPHLRLDVVGEGPRRSRYLQVLDRSLGWYNAGYFDNLTLIEHTPKLGQALLDGRTMKLDDGKTFVLCRFREPGWATRLPDRPPSKVIGEVLVWLHPDDG